MREVTAVSLGLWGGTEVLGASKGQWGVRLGITSSTPSDPNPT